MNDKSYWENFYKDFRVFHPSNFAEFCIEHIPKGSVILDVGCGNGRDSYLFGSRGTVLGIDYAAKPEDTKNVKFKQMDLDELLKREDRVNIIYSRFFLNSISNDKIEKFIKWCKGVVMFEFRTEDPDVKLTYADHERNYVDGSWFLKLLLENNYEILFFVKSRNLSRFKDENPILIRVIAERMA